MGLLSEGSGRSGPSSFPTVRLQGIRRISAGACPDKAAIAENGHLQMPVTPLVRVAQNGFEGIYFLVKQALDMGAFGIM